MTRRMKLSKGYQFFQAFGSPLQYSNQLLKPTCQLGPQYCGKRYQFWVNTSFWHWSVLCALLCPACGHSLNCFNVLPLAVSQHTGLCNPYPTLTTCVIHQAIAIFICLPHKVLLQSSGGFTMSFKSIFPCISIASLG